MILTDTIEALTDWLEENRPDQKSDKPYVLPLGTEAGYELPEDALVLEGLKALRQPYTVVVEVHGITVEVESKYLPV